MSNVIFSWWFVKSKYVEFGLSRAYNYFTYKTTVSLMLPAQEEGGVRLIKQKLLSDRVLSKP